MRSLLPITLLAVVAVGCSAKQRPAQPPAELVVIEETIEYSAGDRTVQATWTRPDVSWRVPAVLFIAGSGPTDRDWNSPLLPGDNGSGALLAHALAERGVASLRYDKYGLDAIDGVLQWSDYASEQRAGLGVLAQRADVDGVWIAGHSEGGLHALALAGEGTEPIAGLVLLATPGRALDQVLVTQVEQMAGRDSAASLDVALTQMRGGREDISVDNPEVNALLRSLQHPQTRPFVDELLFWDPTQRMSAVQVPLLIVQGDKDIQVSSAVDADSLEAAARGVGNDVTRVDLPMSDHTFKLERRPVHELGALAAQSYNAPQRRLDPMLADAIAEWIYR